MLPTEVAPLFFFDGERIEQLADLDKSAQVLSTAVQSLLGLDIVDRLVTDLSVLERRHHHGERLVGAPLALAQTGVSVDDDGYVPVDTYQATDGYLL